MSETNNTGTPKTFSDWISAKSGTANPATQAALANLQKKIEEEAAAKLEKRGMAIFQAVQEQVQTLRQHRKVCKQLETTLARLNALGDKMVAGEIDSEAWEALDRSLDSGRNQIYVAVDVRSLADSVCKDIK